MLTTVEMMIAFWVVLSCPFGMFCGMCIAAQDRED